MYCEMIRVLVGESNIPLPAQTAWNSVTPNTHHHSIANGLLEPFHSMLKAVIMCHEEQQWTEALPMFPILIRMTFRADLKAQLLISYTANYRIRQPTQWNQRATVREQHAGLLATLQWSLTGPITQRKLAGNLCTGQAHQCDNRQVQVDIHNERDRFREYDFRGRCQQNPSHGTTDYTDFANN